MKLLISIANYGDGQLGYLKEIIKNFRSWGIETHICVDTTVSLSDHQADEIRIFPEEITHFLPFTHREYFLSRIEDYDYFIYTENDIFIPWEVMSYIVSLNKQLPEDWICGVCRYEEDEHSEKFLIDMHPAFFPTPRMQKITYEQKDYFVPFNFHSGCYIVTSRQLKRAIDSGGYLVSPHVGPYGFLEQGASDIYTQCGFRTKILPLAIEQVLVHHLPNKYIQGAIARQPPGLPSEISLPFLVEYEAAAPNLKRMRNHSAFSRFLRKKFEKLRKYWRKRRFSLLPRQSIVP